MGLRDRRPRPRNSRPKHGVVPLAATSRLLRDGGRGRYQELRERSTLYSASAAKAPYSNVSRKRCPQHSMTSPARAASDSVICSPHSGQLTR